MKEEVEHLKKEIEDIDRTNALALDEINDLRKERNELLIANIFQAIALILAIVGLLSNK